MFIIVKVFKELFALTENVIVVESSICVFYASRFKRSIVRLVAAHPNKATRWRTKKPEKVTLFPKLSIDVAIRPQVLACTSIKSIIYLIMHKKHPLTSHPAAKRPKHSKFFITHM